MAAASAGVRVSAPDLPIWRRAWSTCLLNGSRQLVQQLAHLAELLRQPLEHAADPPALLDERGTDGDKLAHLVAGEVSDAAD
jgi:hypothetical protein